MTQESAIFKEIQVTRNIKDIAEPQYRRLNVGFESAYLPSFSLVSLSKRIHSIFVRIH